MIFNLTFTFLLLLQVNIFAQSANDKLPVELSPKKDNQVIQKLHTKIAIFPFHDYSDSTLKYLSTYIPELIAGNLSLYKGIEVYDLRVLQQDITSRGMTPESLYFKDNSFKFLKDLKADIGINGRYIVQGNTIRIDFRLIHIDSGKIVNGYEYNDIIDDNLLNTIDRYSTACSEWIVNNELSNIIPDLDFKDKTYSEKYLNRIRESKIGRIIQNKWIFTFLIIISFYFLSKLISLLMKRLFPKLIPLAYSAIDKNDIRKFRRTIKRIIILFGIKLALILFDLSPNAYNTINDTISAFIIALFAYAFIIVMESSLRLWGEDVKEKINPRINRDLMPLFVTFTKITIVTICIIIILSKFNIDVAPFVASIGIFGIAIGFAVKDSITDIIGGIFLALDHSIAAGDMVTIDDNIGIVKEVGLRNTKLLTPDNEIIVIPNSELSSKKYKNYVLPDPSFRVIVKFSVAYGADVDKVEEVINEALKTVDNILDDPPPQIMFTEMDDFSLNFEAKFWIPDYDAKVYKKMLVTKAIYKALNESEIAIPFPTHTIYLKNE